MVAVSSCCYRRQSAVAVDVTGACAIAQLAYCVVRLRRLGLLVRAWFELACVARRAIGCVSWGLPRRRLIIADMAICANGCVVTRCNCSWRVAEL